MKRVLTALVLIPLVLYVVLWGPRWLVYAVTSLVAFLCYYEYAGIAAAYGAGDTGPLGYAAGPQHCQPDDAAERPGGSGPDRRGDPRVLVVAQEGHQGGDGVDQPPRSP